MSQMLLKHPSDKISFGLKLVNLYEKKNLYFMVVNSYSANTTS